MSDDRAHIVEVKDLFTCDEKCQYFKEDYSGAICKLFHYILEKKHSNLGYKRCKYCIWNEQEESNG